MVTVLSSNGVGAGAKNLDQEALDASVVATPGTNAGGQAADLSYLMWLGGVADGIFQWGTAPKARDRQLREFFPKESYLLGALGTVAARNAGFSWTLEGPDRTVKRSQDMLLNANYGKGWDSFIEETTMDLNTQDCGAFVELIRMGGESATETSPVIGIGHLDSARCFQTGNPQEPVYYRDIQNKWHALKWYQVCPLYEMPSGIENAIGGVLYQLQYSAVTRALQNAQVIRNVTIYEDEKTGGNFLKGLWLVTGFAQAAINDAIAKQSLAVDNQGLIRYKQPAVVSSPIPGAKVDAKLLELASLPDHFDKDVTMKWHIASLAMAFLTDYQEFAPLPGGGLGSSNQSQILHAKARGKGPMLFQKLITHMMNFRGALPQNINFKYTEQDIAAEAERETLRHDRAETHQVYVNIGALDKEAVRQKMLDDGDITEEMFADLTKRDMERAAFAMAQATPDAGNLDDGRSTVRDTMKPGAGSVQQDETVLTDQVRAQTKALTDLITVGLKDGPGNTIGPLLQSRIHKAFTDVADDLASLGYLDVDGRIVLSGVIGDTLRFFSNQMDEEAWEIVTRNVEGDDVRGIIGALEKAFGTKEIPPGRLALEAETSDEMKMILDDIQGVLAKELRRRRSTVGEKEVAVVASRPAVVTKEATLVRDDGGMITGAVTRERVDQWE